jgi:hypothetical protein
MDFHSNNLKSLANNDAKVPKRRNRAMKWLGEELETDFHPDNLKLNSVMRLPNNHEEKQVATLIQRQIPTWSQCLEVVGMLHQAIAFIWHWLINSAVRPKRLFASKVRTACTRFVGICQLSEQHRGQMSPVLAEFPHDRSRWDGPSSNFSRPSAQKLDTWRTYQHQGLPLSYRQDRHPTK